MSRFTSSTRVSIDGSDYAEPWCGSATSNGGTRCSYDYVSERAIQPDSKAVGATINHTYRLGNEREFFAEAMLQQNTGSAYDSAAAFDVRVDGDASFVPQWARDLDAEDGEGQSNPYSSHVFLIAVFRTTIVKATVY